jgi:hypothetical protein
MALQRDESCTAALFATALLRYCTAAAALLLHYCSLATDNNDMANSNDVAIASDNGAITVLGMITANG